MKEFGVSKVSSSKCYPLKKQLLSENPLTARLNFTQLLFPSILSKEAKRALNSCRKFWMNKAKNYSVQT